MYRLRRFFVALFCLQILLFPPFSFAIVMKEIEEASAEARELLERARAAAGDAGGTPKSSPSAPVILSNAEITRLEVALKRGEEINSSLGTQIEALEAERARLFQVQAVLTSGIVGAVVTAVIAIAGALVTLRNSRPDRDLKRLAVLEKVRDLQQAGIQLPPDITRSYASFNNEG